MITGEELAAYAAGEADPALVARVESALPDDPDLAARLEQLRTVEAILRDLDPVSMTEDEAARLTTAVDADLVALGAASDPDVVDLTGRRQAAGADDAGSSGRSPRTFSSGTAWWDPMRLAGAAAALVVVVGIAAVALNGLGGGDEAAESADLAATAPRGADGDDSMVELEAEATEEAAAEEAEEPAAQLDAGGQGRDSAVPEAYSYAVGDIPVVDDERVVASIDDIDPTGLRQRLQALVDLGTLERPAEVEATATEAEDTLTESAGGEFDVADLADGRVTATDHEIVAACLPEDPDVVIVAEVILLAPEQPAIAYVLDDRVLVIDAATCEQLADLES